MVRKRPREEVADQAQDDLRPQPDRAPGEKAATLEPPAKQAPLRRERSTVPDGALGRRGRRQVKRGATTRVFAELGGGRDTSSSTGTIERGGAEGPPPGSALTPDERRQGLDRQFGQSLSEFDAQLARKQREIDARRRESPDPALARGGGAPGSPGSPTSAGSGSANAGKAGGTGAGTEERKGNGAFWVGRRAGRHGADRWRQPLRRSKGRRNPRARDAPLGRDRQPQHQREGRRSPYGSRPAQSPGSRR